MSGAGVEWFCPVAHDSRGVARIVLDPAEGVHDGVSIAVHVVALLDESIEPTLLSTKRSHVRVKHEEVVVSAVVQALAPLLIELVRGAAAGGIADIALVLGPADEDRC